MTRLRSRALHSVGYDADSRTLRVRFKHGGLYDYLEVPVEVYAGLLIDPHPWTNWGPRIKSSYEYVPVETPDGQA
jgi:hypothetical protein